MSVMAGVCACGPGDPPPELRTHLRAALSRVAADRARQYDLGAVTLFKLEPVSKTVSIVGNFDCVQIVLPGSGEGMWDIALDKDGNMVGTAASLQNFMLSGALVSIDKANAHCTPDSSKTVSTA